MHTNRLQNLYEYQKTILGSKIESVGRKHLREQHRRNLYFLSVGLWRESSNIIKSFILFLKKLQYISIFQVYLKYKAHCSRTNLILQNKIHFQFLILCIWINCTIMHRVQQQHHMLVWLKKNLYTKAIYFLLNNRAGTLLILFSFPLNMSGWWMIEKIRKEWYFWFCSETLHRSIL